MRPEDYSDETQNRGVLGRAGARVNDSGMYSRHRLMAATATMVSSIRERAHRPTTARGGHDRPRQIRAGRSAAERCAVLGDGVQ